MAETRTFGADLEVRGTDQRIVAGIAVPFGAVAEIAGRFSEAFIKGSFARTIRERGDRVRLLALHDGVNRLPLGRATVLREDSAGLYAELRVSKTQAGDDVLELVRDGAIDGLSVGFAPVVDVWSADRRHVERHEVKLHEISLVTEPAYGDARVLAVRAATTPLRTALLRRRLDFY